MWIKFSTFPLALSLIYIIANIKTIGDTKTKAVTCFLLEVRHRFCLEFGVHEGGTQKQKIQEKISNYVFYITTMNLC
jgi:hypothetical protein